MTTLRRATEASWLENKNPRVWYSHRRTDRTRGPASHRASSTNGPIACRTHRPFGGLCSASMFGCGGHFGDVCTRAGAGCACSARPAPPRRVMMVRGHVNSRLWPTRSVWRRTRKRPLKKATEMSLDFTRLPIWQSWHGVPVS